jgi:hypothetical protein
MDRSALRSEKKSLSLNTVNIQGVEERKDCHSGFGSVTAARTPSGLAAGEVGERHSIGNRAATATSVAESNETVPGTTTVASGAATLARRHALVASPAARVRS